MLSLKDFKKYEVKESAIININGGITCSGVIDVLTYLVETRNWAQHDAVWNQIRNGGIQCTNDDSGEWEVLYA